MILITDARYRMTVALVQSLGRDGHTVAVSYRSDDRGTAIAAYSKYVQKRVCINCSSDDEYGAKLLEYSNSYFEKNGEKLTILPISAVTIKYISHHREEFLSVANVLISTPEVLDMTNDKAEVAKLAKKLDIPIPFEFEKADGQGTEDFLHAVSLPAVVKPRCGEAHKLAAEDRYVIARDYESLKKAYQSFLLYDDAPIVQEYIEGEGIGVSVVMDREKNPVSVFCHRRVREYPIDGGPSTCCISFYDEKLASHASELLRELDYEGIAMVEFKGTNGNYKLLEINPRVWGTFPLTVRANSNFSRAWLEASECKANGLYMDYRHGKKMQFVASDAMAMIAYMKRMKFSKALAVVLDFFNPAVSEGVFDKSDPKPFFLYLLGLLKK